MAELAGVSVGSLYQYFAGKDAFTAALVGRETSLFLDDIAGIDEVVDGAEALQRLIAACVTHQMRRPALARLLDFEEQRLPLHDQQHSMSENLVRTISIILRKLPLKDIGIVYTTAADIFAIARGMIDAAGERGETEMVSLLARVARAVFGYLGLTPE